MFSPHKEIPQRHIKKLQGLCVSRRRYGKLVHPGGQPLAPTSPHGRVLLVNQVGKSPLVSRIVLHNFHVNSGIMSHTVETHGSHVLCYSQWTLVDAKTAVVLCTVCVLFSFHGTSMRLPWDFNESPKQLTIGKQNASRCE